MRVIILPLIATLSLVSGKNLFNIRNIKRDDLSGTDAGLNVLQIIKKHGYPLERHRITTEDGYILEIHRIPHGLRNSQEKNKPVVLLQHGLLCSSADWVNNAVTKNSLAFLLADKGYDVWLGNQRGNTCWDEIGRYDLPAMIDYVILKTGVRDIFYVGHSQGTTAFFVMASERPEYNRKIKLMSALAPVAFMSHVESIFFKILAENEDDLPWITQMLGAYEAAPHSEFSEILAKNLCKDGSQLQNVCADFFFQISGYDEKELNKTLLPVFFTNVPAGAAAKQLIHFAQVINSGRFRKYDYGFKTNLNYYGSPEPPDYNLNRVTAPVALFYSENDLVAAVSDVYELYRRLPNVVLNHKVKLPQFNHMDFLWAIHAKELLYDHIINLMDRYR